MSDVGFTAETLRRETMIKCTYCTRDATQPQHIHPPLCDRHHQIIILTSRARRLNIAVTVANITDLLRQAADRFTITAADVPELLKEIEVHI